MEATVLGSLLSAILLVVSVVLLIGLCGSCSQSNQRTTIQEHFTDDYVQQFNNPQGFIVVRPGCTGLPVSSRSSANSTHLPFASSPMLEMHRPSARIPQADEGSLPSYENPASQDGDYINENIDSDEENGKGGGYIVVLPDPPAAESVSRSQQSLVSTQSSDRGNYVNVDQDDCHSDTSSQNYINVESGGECHELASGVSLDNVDSDNNSNSDYVNTHEFTNDSASVQCER